MYLKKKKIAISIVVNLVKKKKWLYVRKKNG